MCPLFSSSRAPSNCMWVFTLCTEAPRSLLRPLSLSFLFALPSQEYLSLVLHVPVTFFKWNLFCSWPFPVQFQCCLFPLILSLSYHALKNILSLSFITSCFISCVIKCMVSSSSIKINVISYLCML